MINVLKSTGKLKPPVRIGLAGFSDFGPLRARTALKKKNLPDQNLLAHLFVKSGGRALTGKVFLKQLNLK